MARLIFKSERFEGQVYALSHEKTTVGRGVHNRLVIPDEAVAMDHCMILAHGAEILVCGGKAGAETLVDGVLVEGQCQVKTGQRICFGRVEAEVEIELYDEEGTGDAATAVGGFLKSQVGGSKPVGSRSALGTRVREVRPATARELGGRMGNPILFLWVMILLILVGGWAGHVQGWW
jgi:hypothetical protein